MNLLSSLSLFAVVTGVQHQQISQKDLTTHVLSVVQSTKKLNLFGPNVKGTPRVLGTKGVERIQKGKFKMEDFTPFSSLTGKTVPKLTSLKPAVGMPTALVLYDTEGQWGWIGNLYSYQIANLLTHFGVTVTREGVTDYKAGDLAAYGSAYYIGTTYNAALPPAFLSDFASNSNPFVWMGYNLWEVAWTPDGSGWNPDFTAKYGFQFSYLDGTGYPTVKYKNSTLTKQQYDPMQGDTVINDPAIASAIATSTNGATTVPYITKGANLWYIGDNPLEYVAYNRGDDRMLAFDDILNDTTGAVGPFQKRAVLRIEDVSPICDSKSLRRLADALYKAKVPFVVSVIPDYKDPLGEFNSGVALEILMQNKKTFIADLKYMESKGGQLIMHGITHQYSNVQNPYDGVSAADVEFFQVGLDANGAPVNVGPIPEDSPTWIANRIASGFNMFSKAGLTKPVGWNSPHYYATPTDYTAFASKFGFSMDRALTFVTDNNKNLQYMIGYSPYVMQDQYGNRRIPETIGYYDPDGSNGKKNLAADMIGYANQLQCVRGGWAGCYYHWFEPVAPLVELVNGIKALGYTFVSPTGTTN